MNKPKKILVAPSILSANFSKLGDEIKKIEKGGANWVHIDVMDGIFVPNITIGPLVVKSIRPLTRMFFDVHLMIVDPIKHVDAFIAAGADMITFHVEACPDAEKIITKIKASGKKVGVSIKPGTDISTIEHLLGKVDMVLVMTVEPGFGGQSFMENMLHKVEKLRTMFKGYIQVDGGINKDTSKKAIHAGADVLVAGTAVFGEKEYAKAIRALKNRG